MTIRKKRVRADYTEPQGPFFCKMGRHYLFPDDFENDPRNEGICAAHAFGLFELMRHHFPVWAEPDDDELARKKRAADVARDLDNRIAPLKAGSNEPGWVYYVEQGDLLKVGYSTAPLSRMKSYGPTAHLMAIHPGTPAVEKDMHARFRRYLSRGREWYSRALELLEHIAAVREQFGDPGVFAYAYTTPKSTLDTPKWNRRPMSIG